MNLAGAMWGLLVGDALGVPYEFHSPDQLPPASEIEMTPPPGFRRAHVGVEPGTWSDDGAQALCLLDSLLACDRLDADDLMRRLVRWHEQGYLAVDGNVFDMGIQTGRALDNFRRGVAAEEAGPSGERDNGNGSLMRVLPLALWHRGDDRSLADDACRQSRITHGHPRAQVACALYCLWARRILQGASDPWQAAVDALKPLTAHGGELDGILSSDEKHGTGYVVDTLRSARWAVAQGPYETVVKAAISLGNDTDTTACVAGGIAGLRDGLDAIPGRWLQMMRGRELAAPLVARLER